ncbi:MAG: zinc-binding dehydrogenase, partial [Coleofasciculaceae cyanobacterium]
AQTLALTGCNLLVIGRHTEKLANLEALGIKTGFAEAVTSGSFDISVECTGNPEGFAIARRALRSRGTLILKSTYAGKLTFDASSLVVDEITLIGSRCGPFQPAIKLLSENKVDVSSLIQAHYTLSEGLAAFEHAQRRGVLKVLLEMGAEVS